MLKIEVKDGTVNTRSSVNKKTGETLEFYDLEAWAHLIENGYPERIKLNMRTNEDIKPGFYTLKQSSFYIGDYKKLMIGRVDLEPIVFETSTLHD